MRHFPPSSAGAPYQRTRRACAASLRGVVARRGGRVRQFQRRLRRDGRPFRGPDGIRCRRHRSAPTHGTSRRRPPWRPGQAPPPSRRTLPTQWRRPVPPRRPATVGAHAVHQLLTYSARASSLFVLHARGTRCRRPTAERSTVVGHRRDLDLRFRRCAGNGILHVQRPTASCGETPCDQRTRRPTARRRPVSRHRRSVSPASGRSHIPLRLLPLRLLPFGPCRAHFFCPFSTISPDPPSWRVKG